MDYYSLWNRRWSDTYVQKYFMKQNFNDGEYILYSPFWFYYVIGCFVFQIKHILLKFAYKLIFYSIAQDKTDNIWQENILVLLFLSLPPVCWVCPNYEVVVLQPYLGTSTSLRYVANCYVAILISTACHFRPPPWINIRT